MRTDKTTGATRHHKGDNMKSNTLNAQAHTPRRVRSWFVLCSLAMLAAASSALGAGNVANPNIMPPQSHPYDLSYGQWAARYWQWSLSFPATANPAADTAPLESNQSGPVWFLASVTGKRAVTRQMNIPSGTSLFFPALRVYWKHALFPGDPTPQAAR